MIGEVERKSLGALLGSIAILISAVCYAVNIILMRRQAESPPHPPELPGL